MTCTAGTSRVRASSAHLGRQRSSTPRSPLAARLLQVMVQGHHRPWRAGIRAPIRADDDGALENALAASATAETKHHTPQKSPNSAPATTKCFWKHFSEQICSGRCRGRSVEGALDFKLSRQKRAPVRGSEGRSVSGPGMPPAEPGWPQSQPDCFPPGAS